MALGFLKMFMPKDRIFYELFERMTGILVEMGDALVAAMNEPDYDKRKLALKKLEDFEHRCDEVTHNLFIELGRNFITPFDREDIHSLATALDDIADFIWGSGKRILNYNVESIDQIMKDFSVIIKNAIVSLDSGMKELRDMKHLEAITQCCVTVNSLENEADDLLDKAILALFSTQIDPIDLIKRKDLYEEMELVTDKCEDAANVIETIIIKYS